MGSGIEAVKDEIQRQFGGTDFNEHFDVDTFSTVLSFKAEQRIFSVRVSAEFDQDYGSGSTVGLEELGLRLRASVEGKVTVRTTTIS